MRPENAKHWKKLWAGEPGQVIAAGMIDRLVSKPCEQQQQQQQQQQRAQEVEN
jgi:hypothetical protein